MSNDRAAHASRATLAYALLLAATACVPIPVSHSELVTPNVTGVLRRGDGAPLTGVAVAVTGTQEDPSCERSGARAVTDSLGRFYLPLVTIRKRIFWFTWAERFGTMGYWLCADFGGPAAELAPPPRAVIDGHVWGDTIACLAWDWRGRQRATCNGWQAPRIVTGGAWADGDARGSYQVILAEVDAWNYQSRAYVQWIETSPAGEPRVVRAVAEVPTADDVRTGSAVLAKRDGQWCLTLTSIKRVGWDRKLLLTFELGPPGQLRPAASQ